MDQKVTSHIHSTIDFCVETYVVNDNYVLLRKHEKYHIWLGVGGHIRLDEDPNESAIRKVKEEANLDVILFYEQEKIPKFTREVKSLIPPQYINRHRIDNVHEHIALIYFAYPKEVLKKEIKIPQECSWFNEKDLQENIHNFPDDTVYYATSALKQLEKNILLTKT